MKNISFIVVIGLLLNCLPSEAFLNCKSGDVEIVTLAEELYKTRLKLFEDALIKKSDVLRSQVFFNEAKFCSQTISTKDFCDVVIPILKELNATSNAYYAQVTLHERLERISLLAEAKKLCEN